MKIFIDRRGIKYADDLSEVLSFVAKETGVEPSDIIPKCAGKKKVVYVISEARHIYNYIARIYTQKSLREIGAQINRDHASVLNSVNTVIDWMDTNDVFKARVIAIEKKITKMLK